MDWPQAGANPQRTAYQSAETLGTTFSVAWRYQFALTPSPAETLWPQQHAIVSASKVLVGTQMGNLRAFVAGAAGGAVSWVHNVGAPILGSVASDGTNVYVGDAHGRLTSYVISSGALRWGPVQITDGRPFMASLLYADSVVMLGGADGWFYGINPATGAVLWSRAIGAPILQTAAGDGAGKVVFGAQNMKVYCLNTSTGGLIWSTPALAGTTFKDYWPVIIGSKVLLRPQAAYGVPGGGVPSTPLRSIEVIDWTNDATMTSALAAYDASPSSYAKSLFVLSLTDGSETANQQIIHRNFAITMHGAPPPVVLENGGYLVIPFCNTTNTATGWVRADLTTRKIHDGLIDSNGTVYSNAHGWANTDENVLASACSNGVLVMHTQETNAQTTGFFQQTGSGSPAWHQFGPGAGTSELYVNTQGGGGSQGAISGGLVYHCAHPHTLVAWQAS